MKGGWAEASPESVQKKFIEKSLFFQHWSLRSIARERRTQNRQIQIPRYRCYCIYDVSSYKTGWERMRNLTMILIFLKINWSGILLSCTNFHV